MIDRIPAVPPTPGTIVTIVPDEYEAAEWLFQFRWPEGFECRRCGGTRATHLRCRPRVWQCRCGAFNSVTAGTVLHRTRIPLGKILLACVLLSRPGSISSNRLRAVLGVRYETAYRLAHRLRLAVGLEKVSLDYPMAAATIGLRKRARPGEIGQRIKVWGVFDRSGRAAVTVGDRDIALSQQRLLEQVSPGICDPHNLPAARLKLEGLRRVAHRTHQRVSRRWSRRYAQAWAWFEGRKDPLSDLVCAILRTPPRPWSSIPPSRLEPPWRM